MYSQKNRNKSFIYEEEIDQLNRERSSKRPTSGDSKWEINKGSQFFGEPPRIQRPYSQSSERRNKVRY